MRLWLEDPQARARRIRGLKLERMLLMVLILLGLVPLVVAVLFLGYAVHTIDLKLMSVFADRKELFDYLIKGSVIFEVVAFVALFQVLHMHDFLMLADELHRREQAPQGAAPPSHP